MWANFDVVGGWNKQRTVRYDAQDSINWYVIFDRQGKKTLALQGTPGLELFETVQILHAVRAQYTYADKMYVVAGNKVYKYSLDMTKEEVGEIGTFSGYVSIASNNAGQLMFVDGTNGWIYNTVTDSFDQITSPYFPENPLNVVFLDSYFVVPQGGSTQFSLSAPNNGLEWDAFDTALIQAYSTNLVGVGVVNRRLFFFKETSTEVWYNTGAPDFPLRRDNNLIFNYGCISTASIQSEHGYLFWISRDKDGVGSVMMSDGQVPVPVSTDSVEDQLRTFTAPGEVRSFVYKDDSHIFYMMNWTTDDFTFCFDATTMAAVGKEDAWHRRMTIPHKAVAGQPFSAKTRNIPECHAFFNNTHYVGSYKDAKLYAQSINFGSNAGEPIIRERVFRHLSQPNYAMQQLDGFQLDFQTGIGANSGIYRAPQAYLSVSRDGGQTFGNKRPAPMGRIGKRQTRTIWRLLGTNRDFVLKVSIYAEVKPIFMLGGAIDMKVLNV